MLRKNFLKFALIIPAMAGVCVMASTPDFSAKKKDKTATAVAAVEEKVTVDKTVHDFGTIQKDGGRVSAVFTITNSTKTPIILSEVRASCGCTTPDWTKEPIETGKTGTVTATYNPTGSGPFEKSVTINISSGDKTEMMIVKIKGTVAE
jgi:hypothetical protein